MAAEHRRVVAETTGHARALADNLVAHGYVLVTETPQRWELRKSRWRGDITVTIDISTPAPGTPAPWGPPTGPPAS